MQPTIKDTEQNGIETLTSLTSHRNELRQLVQRYGPSNPRVFGSTLSGTDTDESALDLLVEPAPTTSLLNIAGLKIDTKSCLEYQPRFWLQMDCRPGSNARSWTKLRPL